jgi:HD-GYP domain-containing protein (c-di-GMP phosphodiesterase class II)
VNSSKKLVDVPHSLNEEYYQINPDILGSFSKYRPPLDIFHFKEDISRIEPYYRVGGRLSNEQIEQVQKMVHEGFIFVSRKDHPVYVKHISYQLDLVLVDKNLKESEIADIFMQALTMRMENFLEQPVKPVFDRLREDIMVLTEYLWSDFFRIKALLRRLQRNHTLAAHSVNCGVVGLALFHRLYTDDFKSGKIKRKTYNNLAVGLLLHDMGMTKIPPFVRNKDKPLTIEEQNKVLAHPTLAYEMLAKLDLKYPEVERCVLEHHERADGSGYPQKLKAQDMSPLGKMCAVVDSYCAMISKRPYKEAMEPNEAATSLVGDPRYDRKMAALLQSMVITGRGK